MARGPGGCGADPAHQRPAQALTGPRLPGPGRPRTHERRTVPCGRCARRTTARAPRPRADRGDRGPATSAGGLAAVGVIDIGGLNAVAAVLAAARLGAPVLDGDLMGRAFPRINRTTVAVTGHRAAPPTLAGPVADTVMVPTASASMAEADRRPWTSGRRYEAPSDDGLEDGVGDGVGDGVAASTWSSTVTVAPPAVVIRSRNVPAVSSAYSFGRLNRPPASVRRPVRVRTTLPAASLK
ncbi:DUF917 family protein [Streptomyces nodosus]|uniref:DUF917 family protein n=1 Tax=Streptomyces nodosus TaxID=40318 RepID=A0A5P2W3C4_9ACTN|nr:DUF917 family protein [Streptomyces nodosus]